MIDEISTADTPVANAVASRKTVRNSFGATLVRAAALAAVLVPLGSVAAEASSCHFGGATSCATNGGGEGFTLFDFGSGGSAPYRLGLRFDQVIGEFDVTITDFAFTEAEMLARLTAFPGYQPVPIGDDPVRPYIEFRVTGQPAPCTTDAECEAANNTWRSDPSTRGPATEFGYDMRIYWLADTDAMFPDPHFLHNTGDDDELYDFDMTVPGSYATFVPCDVFNTCSARAATVGDPAIGGRDDMFNAFTLADPTATDVPEPASLLLLGSGISGLVYRRRRRKQDA
jgi:PEP-CTERM motif